MNSLTKPHEPLLTLRQTQVLSALVSAYVGEAAQVASDTVAALLPVRLSPASVRNTLGELHELGLQGSGALGHRSIVLASYALAGFANFGSIAMQVAGMGELAPGKRAMLAQLGMRALLGGMVAGLMTAAVAGILLP